MLTMLASQLGKMQNRLLIEGHTDARPTIRARLFELGAIDGPGQQRAQIDAGNRRAGGSGGRSSGIRRISACANPKDPDSASNRRVSIVVKYWVAAAESAAPLDEASEWVKKAFASGSPL